MSTGERNGIYEYFYYFDYCLWQLVKMVEYPAIEPDNKWRIIASCLWLQKLWQSQNVTSGSLSSPKRHVAVQQLLILVVVLEWKVTILASWHPCQHSILLPRQWPTTNFLFGRADSRVRGSVCWPARRSVSPAVWTLNRRAVNFFSSVETQCEWCH